MNVLGGILNRNNTFRPKQFKKGSQRHELHNKAKETLGSGDLVEAVKVPPGESLNEWLAVNTVDFYNTTNLIYGSISEFCTNETCPVMGAGLKYEYLWMDGNLYKKPTKLSASEYVANLMDWIEHLINNEELFPTDSNAFPKNFISYVKNIFKRMFRVYAHIYYSHFEEVKDLGIEKHLNTAFKHFIIFVNEFNLIDKKELAPLKETIDEILQK